ncbi:ead/Ea22-like family protein [Salmonella enterica]|nr:ead/Ea22-like family protein [Salmonella enterica]
MTIDKQALREAAEKVNSGEWSYEEFNRMDLPGGAHIRINGRGAIYCLNKPTGGIEQSRAVMAYIAAFNPKVALALLDELEHYKSREERVTKLVLDNSTSWDVLYEKLEAAEKRIAEQREYYEGVIADGSKRIAELESKNGNLRTIAHDQNELAIRANLDSINDTVEMDRLHKRIAELEAREIKPSKGEVLVTVSGFTGCGKSAIAGEIEIAMKAIGVPVQWSNGDAEKRMTGADWLTAIEMYRPTVRIVEVNVPRAAGIKVEES